jgi:glyoxylase-like metal-dependent hydrolase (beta-lactamase superfamily II)
MSEPILLSARNPGPLTGPGNNTWLLDGDEPTLIDAGTGAPEHLSSIAAHLGDRRLTRVLVTHGHPDHASGITALRSRWPALEAWKWPASGEADWHVLHDGQTLRAADRFLQVVHTPGHAPDHVCFWDARSRDLFGGDMMIQDTTVMIPAGHGGSLRDYLHSLERIAALRPRRVFPGHGSIIDRPADLIAEYQEHRRLRERQVRECLAAGLSDVDAIVSKLYPNISQSVRPAARLTIQAHLQKLQEEGHA